MIMRKSALIVLSLTPPLSWGFAPPQAPLPKTGSSATSSKISTSTSTTQLQSVPTSIDTFTSGLASIARLPRGVTVSGGVSSAGPAAIYLPKILKLYDVENDRNCRTVRERITELDVVVEQVIPAASNSRVVENSSSSKITLPTMVAEVDGKEVTLKGVDDILEFFDEKFSTEKEMKDKKEQLSKQVDADGISVDQVKDTLSDVLSFLPGTLRAGRGSKVCSAASPALSPPRPDKPLILYSYEGNQFCRLVREVLTELDIVYELRSAGKESPRREELASITGGSSQCPYLIDPNTDVNMAESKDIIEYLYAKYALWAPPSELLRTASNIVTPLLAPVYTATAPLQAGSSSANEFEYKGEIAEAKAEIYDEISSSPVVIYTYELSPFCTEAVALLKSTGTNFKEISLGKEWIPGLIDRPEKRAALLEMTGQSSLPNVFIGGTSVGGLYSGKPGLIPSLEKGELTAMIEEAKISM